ncbi:MAG: succinylglutamate desuccinylase/aspartoacylase family protein [Burkholderiaceae bacterium]
MPDAAQRSLIQTDIDFHRSGYQYGHLRLPYSHDRSGYGYIPIPIAMCHGGEGPTLLLTGGNHGDEYEGPVGLMKLVRRMPSMAVKGRVIVIPALNFPALLNATRTSPIDGGNLNRAFPGQRNGTLTEMIAHFVDTELFPLCDVAFDIHAGGASTNYLPTLLAALPQDAARRLEYRRLVEAVGAPRVLIMDLLGEDRTFGAAAERRGLHFLCGEFGGHATCNVDGLHVVEAGVRRLMAAMGMIDALPAEPAPVAQRLVRVDGRRHYVFAPVGGVFEPAFRLGDTVRAGESAGWIHDPRRPDQAPCEVAFAGDGFVICTRTLAQVEPGDCLAHLAEDTCWH